MNIGYEDNPRLPTFEILENIFLDDITNLAKDQSNAEDAENARHRERINEINSEYEAQLAELRARHASQREEFLRKESLARQQQYRQITMENYPPNSAMVAPAAGDAQAYGTPAREARDHYDSYKEHIQFHGGSRDHGHGYESRGPYPGGRAYGSGSRYY